MKKLLVLLLLALLMLPLLAAAEDAPTIDIGTLTPVELPAQPEALRSALYCGPTQGSYRSGEVMLDTAEPFVYFGQYDCWAMVAPGTLEDMGPIGWVEAAAFVAPYEPLLSFDDALAVMIEDDATLTDTPFAGEPNVLCVLPRGETVTLLAQYEGWGYVQTELDGKPIRAFIPLSTIL